MPITDIISPLGGTGAGVEYYGTAYPFIRPYDRSRALLANLWLSHSVRSAVLPLRIDTLWHFGRALNTEAPEAEGEHKSDLLIVDANGTPICDTREGTYSGRAFGSRFFIHAWLLADSVCTVVQHSKISQDEFDDAIRRALEDEDLRITESGEIRWLEQYMSDITPTMVLEGTSGVLDPRTHEIVPERVSRIGVASVDVYDNLVLRAGYNIQIDVEQASRQALPALLAEAFRPITSTTYAPITRIRISAIAGAGEGPAPGCPDVVEGLRTIGQVAPNQYGNIQLSADACLYADRKKDWNDTYVPATLVLGNQCTPCRNCEDYVSTYEDERVVRDRLKTVQERLNEASNLLGDLGTRWEAARICRGALPQLKVYASKMSFEGTDPIPANPDEGEAGDPGTPDLVYVTFGVSVCNNTAECLEPAEVRIEVSGLSLANVQTVPGSSLAVLQSGEISTGLTGWPTITKTWAVIKPNVSVQAQGTFKGEGSNGTLNYSAQLYAGGEPIGDPVVGSI